MAHQQERLAAEVLVPSQFAGPLCVLPHVSLLLLLQLLLGMQGLVMSRLGGSWGVYQLPVVVDGAAVLCQQCQVDRWQICYSSGRQSPWAAIANRYYRHCQCQCLLPAAHLAALLPRQGPE
jgi:hypothetical protein